MFHPTGIHGAGTLVTEGCRGEGGYLINKDAERFMELCKMPKITGSRCCCPIWGLGDFETGLWSDGDHVYLKLDHLGEEALNAKLPNLSWLVHRARRSG